MDQPPPAPKAELSLAQGRLLIFLAAILWSSNGFFGKILTRPGFGLDHPPLQPLQIAFYRLLFAGLFLLPLLFRARLTVKPAMIGMALSFAAMNAMFITALTLGKSANAILLQYTAPLWMYLACVWLFRERAEWRNTVMLLFGLAGIAIILAGGWQDEQIAIILLGVGSGVTFGSILLFLRVLRGQDSAWLTVWNHLTAALLLAPFGLVASWEPLTFWDLSGPQLGVLVIFGALQMGFPYFLMARGLRVVSPQEAGAITLLEPLLNPLWAYLVSPATETPGIHTFLGGALILTGLAWRYRPRGHTGRSSIR